MKHNGAIDEKPENRQNHLGAWPLRARSVCLIAVLAAAVAALYLTELSGLRPPGGDHPAVWPLVVLGTWAAATYKVPVRDRRASFSVSLTGIPLLLAVPFLAPWAALLAFFCGRLAAQLQGRKALDKAVVNCLVSVTTMGIGILFYDHALGRSSPADWRGWLVASATVAIVSVAELASVVAAAAVFNWRWSPPPLGPTLAHAALDVVISAVGGVTAIVLMVAGTWDVTLFAVLVAVGDAGWRRAARAAQRHAALHRLYVFTEQLAMSEGGERELVTAVLEGARSLLSASRAVLAVPLEQPLDHLMLRCSLEGEGAVRIEEAVERDDVASRVASRGPFILKRTAAARDGQGEAASGFREAVAAPLRPGDPRTGYLLVADRPFTHEGFGPADMQLLGMVAASAVVALGRGGLVDKLRHEAALYEWEAHHDRLTRLANRWLFMDNLERVTRAQDWASRVAVYIIDLDGFKQVNVTLGRESGDAVLCEVARRLGPLEDDRTLVARVGGDQFALLVEDAGGEQECLAAAGALVAAIAAPMQVEGLELVVHASAGVARAAPGRATAPELLRQAETAALDAKSHGGGARAYDASSELAGARRVTLAAELRKAVESGTLELHYQAVARMPTGAVSGFEALARWTHEELGTVPPERFIPVAEKSGLIEPLTWWALATALREVKVWRQLAPDLSVSVNLSAFSLLKRDLARHVGEALSVAGLPPSALRFELTETSMMAELGKKALGELRELGVPLSIDDFGTGYSSFSRLRLLPFDEVKIDRSFVSHMCEVSEDEAVVRSVIELARGLGKAAIAEGVEDRTTFDRLASLGCHAVQGYYLARPLPAGECEALLRSARSSHGGRVLVAPMAPMAPGESRWGPRSAGSAG